MHRFYLPASECREDTLKLSPRDARHAVKVLRLRLNDRLSVLDGEGGELLCRAIDVEKSSVLLRVLTRNAHPPLPCEVTLVQAVTKGKSMDVIVQKATELGCRRLVPVFSERSVIQCVEADLIQKQEKWQTIAIEAMKQCGQAWLPEVLKPTTLAEFISGTIAPGDSLSLVASLQPDATHPQRHLANQRAGDAQDPKRISVWIGPEGDFTPAELNAIKNTGALPISLGPLILRSETAALYALSVVNYELQTSHASKESSE